MNLFQQLKTYLSQLNLHPLPDVEIPPSLDLSELKEKVNSLKSSLEKINQDILQTKARRWEIKQELKNLQNSAPVLIQNLKKLDKLYTKEQFLERKLKELTLEGQFLLEKSLMLTQKEKQILQMENRLNYLKSTL